MGVLYRNRPLLGNVGLLLFVAFLAMVLFPAYAPAGDQMSFYVRQTYPGATPEWVSVGGTAQLVTDDSLASTAVEIAIVPLTEQDFQAMLPNLWFTIKRGDQVVATVYANQATYEQVYVGVYAGYKLVYQWAYAFSQLPSLPQSFTLTVYCDGQQKAGFTLQVDRPPERESVGGGPSGGPSVTTRTVDTGTVESTTTTSTLTADAAKVEQLAATQPQVELVVPQDLVKGTNRVAVSADALAKAFDAGKPVVVGAGDAKLTIPPQAMDYKPLVGQGLTVRTEFAKADVGTLPASYRAAGDAWDVAIRVLKGTEDKGGISSFLAKVTLALPYKADGLDENKLGLYRSTDGSWAYRVGKVYRAGKQVIAWLTSLSRYAALAYEKTFADVATHWARNDIEIMAARHVVQGMPDGTFAPDAGVTRAQFAAFVTRCLGLEPGGAAGFSDVPANAWYAGVVAAAAKAGIVKGFEDGTFRPDEPITREQVAAMVTRALAVAGKEVTVTPAEREQLLAAFADRGAIGGWALDAVAVAVKEGIVRGRTVDTFAPQAGATRAEAVTMLKRLVTSAGWLS
ncbi:MAG: S-layer homology domain-containing protein [Desulfotomaculales bacterium]